MEVLIAYLALYGSTEKERDLRGKKMYSVVFVVFFRPLGEGRAI